MRNKEKACPNCGSTRMHGCLGPKWNKQSDRDTSDNYRWNKHSEHLEVRDESPTLEFLVNHILRKLGWEEVERGYGG